MSIAVGNGRYLGRLAEAAGPADHAAGSHEVFRLARAAAEGGHDKDRHHETKDRVQTHGAE